VFTSHRGKHRKESYRGKLAFAAIMVAGATALSHIGSDNSDPVVADSVVAVDTFTRPPAVVVTPSESPTPIPSKTVTLSPTHTTSKHTVMPRVDKGSVKALAQTMMVAYGWDGSQFRCLDKVYTYESGWNYRAANARSGAYGIPQSLPARKMASAGSDWRTNPATQLRWGLKYIHDVYRTPCGAWAHEVRTGWY